MLDSQEKIMDNSAELDALRARRYAEAKERAAREAVLKKETWRKNLAESVHKTLGDQIEDKKRRQAREAALQEREHNECLRYANKVQDREAIENERKRQINEEFKRTLNEQIAAARRGRTDKFQQAQDEGRAMRNEFAMERAKLEAIALACREEATCPLDLDNGVPLFSLKMLNATVRDQEVQPWFLSLADLVRAYVNSTE